VLYHNKTFALAGGLVVSGLAPEAEGKGDVFLPTASVKIAPNQRCAGDQTGDDAAFAGLAFARALENEGEGTFADLRGGISGRTGGMEIWCSTDVPRVRLPFDAP
jgi:hypothetical protein